MDVGPALGAALAGASRGSYNRNLKGEGLGLLVDRFRNNMAIGLAQTFRCAIPYHASNQRRPKVCASRSALGQLTEPGTEPEDCPPPESIHRGAHSPRVGRKRRVRAMRWIGDLVADTTTKPVNSPVDYRASIF